MANLVWNFSYETLKFDTPDGDLHEGQFAFHKGIHYVRLHPENNKQFVALEGLDRPVDIPATIAGLTEVHVLDGATMYYDEFVLPNGRIFRKPSVKSEYASLGLKDAPPRSHTLTAKEITDAQANDAHWQGKDVKLK